MSRSIWKGHISFGLVNIPVVLHSAEKQFDLHFRLLDSRFKNKLVSLDATVIDLCLSLYDWAKFRRTKGAVKLHLVLDHDGYLPCFGLITNGKVPDVTVAHQLAFAPGTIVVDDRGYNDYRLFAEWTATEVFFVTRLKANAQFEVVEEHEPPPHRRILKDQTILLIGSGGPEKCPHVLRRN